MKPTRDPSRLWLGFMEGANSQGPDFGKQIRPSPESSGLLPLHPHVIRIWNRIRAVIDQIPDRRHFLTRMAASRFFRKECPDKTGMSPPEARKT